MTAYKPGDNVGKDFHYDHTLGGVTIIANDNVTAGDVVFCYENKVVKTGQLAKPETRAPEGQYDALMVCTNDYYVFMALEDRKRNLN